MKSLDLNRRYYHECVRPVLLEGLPGLSGDYAAGLVGWGSEVLGNDDIHSRAYGWGPRVALFLRELDLPRWRGRIAALLEAQIPPTFLGHPTRFTDPNRGPPLATLEPGGWLQIPITTCSRFTELYLGRPTAELQAPSLTSRDWLALPEQGLLRVTAGEVYHDGVGELTTVRRFFASYPDDVWRYRLVYQWTALSWDIDLIGLCAARQDLLSSRLAVARSVDGIVKLAFLLNRVYHPGYLKWVHRQFAKLPHLASDIGPLLQRMLVEEHTETVLGQLYRILDDLIAFQRERTGLPEIDYRHAAKLDRGFFAYCLDPVINGLRETLTGELAQLPCPVGAVDQWVVDQDLLMSPLHLSSLGSIYDTPPPSEVLFRRTQWEYFL